MKTLLFTSVFLTIVIMVKTKGPKDKFLKALPPVSTGLQDGGGKDAKGPKDKFVKALPPVSTGLQDGGGKDAKDAKSRVKCKSVTFLREERSKSKLHYGLIRNNERRAQPLSNNDLFLERRYLQTCHNQIKKTEKYYVIFGKCLRFWYTACAEIIGDNFDSLQACEKKCEDKKHVSPNATWCYLPGRDCDKNIIGKPEVITSLKMDGITINRVESMCKTKCLQDKDCGSIQVDMVGNICWLKSEACTFNEQIAKKNGHYYVRLANGESCEKFNSYDV